MTAGRDPNVASRAARPSAQDLAIAEEVIPGELATSATPHRHDLIERVKERFVGAEQSEDTERSHPGLAQCSLSENDVPAAFAAQ